MQTTFTKKLFVFLFFLPLTSTGQMILLEEDFNSGIPATWAIVDGDGLTPHADVSEFTSAWINRQGDEDTTAASTSYYDPAGQSEDYLILPKQSILSFTKLVWSARSVDASYPDSYYVLISTTDSLIESFTDTLLMVEEENFIWQTRSLHLDTMGYASQDVYIAFRNYTNDGFILEIDNVKITSDDNVGIPEEKLDFTVYPNPTQEKLFVANSTHFNSEFVINDISGKEWIRTTSPSIDVSKLPSGVYLIKTHTNESVYTSRFVKR